MRRKFKAGGTGIDPEFEDWKTNVEKGIVVTKIVKVSQENEEMLSNITRFTNSQNAVKEKDFLALEENFQMLKQQMESRYDVFLEIQRGAWDSRKAWQKQHPREKQFRAYANAFDLLKVYGAGWLGQAGNAFSKNAYFLAGGVVFEKIFSASGEEKFSVDDLNAAYQLQQAAEKYKFGRMGTQTRRLTKFLFFHVTIELLKKLMIRAQMQPTNKETTRVLRQIWNAGEYTNLLDYAAQAVDEYMTSGADNSIFDEPKFKEMSNNINNMLKSEHLGSNDEGSVFPKLIGDFVRLITRNHPSLVALLADISTNK